MHSLTPLCSHHTQTALKITVLKYLSLFWAWTVLAFVLLLHEAD